MRRHLERAVAMATEGGRASARCEALARLAIEVAGFVGRDASGGAATTDGGVSDPELVELVERSAAQVKELSSLLPGHAPWGAQADAALATVALVRGDVAGAADSGGAAVQALQAGLHEDANLEIVLPSARAIFAGASPEVQEFARDHLQSTLSRIAQGTADESIRVRWLSGPIGRQLVELAGPVDTRSPDSAAATGSGPEARFESADLDDAERRLLQLLTEGRTNAEIAADIDVGEDEVAQRLLRLQARLGTSSRAEATSLAFRGLAAVGST